MSNKITKMAKQLLIIEGDLWYRFSPDKYTNFVSPDDFDIYAFEQTWGSTALGFGGIGCSAITTEYTYVFVPVTCSQKAFVYFGSKFAYEADVNEIFKEDLKNMCMRPCIEAGLYRKDEE